MKVMLAGAFGNLGSDILRHLIDAGHSVVACDIKPKEMPGYEGKFETKIIDVTKPETLKGTCDGCDAVITTVGLVGKSKTLSNYDIDLNGNLAILKEAKAAGVKNFGYVSVIKCDSDPNVPMLEAKHQFEEKLKVSGLKYVIFRPTGYFYDIAKVFMPMIEKGKVTLLGHKDFPCNVIDTTDLADFIVKHIEDDGKTYSIGGKESYTYKQIAEMFFAAAGKPCKISRAPAFLFDLPAKKAKKEGGNKEALIRFSKWTLTHDLVGDTMYGNLSFAEYIKSRYPKEK